jgi:hypothetical protein
MDRAPCIKSRYAWVGGRGATVLFKESTMRSMRVCGGGTSMCTSMGRLLAWALSQCGSV